MQLRFWQHDLKLAHTWTIARGSAAISSVVLVELTSASGLKGLGEASPTNRYNESPESVKTFLSRLDTRGLSFENVEGNMAYLDGLSVGEKSAKCALNIALLDGAGKSRQEALHAHLGLPFRESAHATSFSIGIDKPRVIREKVEAAAEFPILKLKVGNPDDLAMLAALRDAAPQKPVRVDANEGWATKEEALHRIERLAGDGKIQFVEQPMPANTPEKDLVWLKQRSPLPLFADESYHSAKDAPRCAECFHGVNVKLVKTGGVSEGFEALKAARTQGLKTMLGCMIETSVLISAAAHLAELCDFLDLDGNLLVTNDPFDGVTARNGILSFAQSTEPFGLRVRPKA